MRAVLMTAAGGPEVLEVAELPEPKMAGDHDVRVRLRAAGLNPVDCKLRTSRRVTCACRSARRSRLSRPRRRTGRWRPAR